MKEIKKQADEMLENIGEVLIRRDWLQSRADDAMRDVTERYGPQLQSINDTLKEKEKALITLMKKAKGRLFDGVDIVRLENGVLIYNKEEKISIPKGALALAEEQGLTDAIKIAKSIDRGVVETWPDERLFLIGAIRKVVEKFNYEVKGK